MRGIFSEEINQICLLHCAQNFVASTVCNRMNQTLKVSLQRVRCSFDYIQMEYLISIFRDKLTSPDVISSSLKRSCAHHDNGVFMLCSVEDGCELLLFSSRMQDDIL